MSMMATGPLPARRPGASSAAGIVTFASRSLGAPAEGLWRVCLKRFPTAGEARIGHEILVGVKRLLAFLRRDSLGAAVRQYPPALLVVRKIGDHDLADNLLVDRWVENRRDRLDPAVEVARHHVGGADVDDRLRRRQAVTVAETEDAGVFEEASDDRLDADAIGQAGNAGPQAADAAHHQIDVD